MQIGQVIRKYRKEKDMTQEEMANRLGVTAPAVNKWEKGNSLPDITLLSPIARLLDISLDTLLSYREELTTEEIQDIIWQVNSTWKDSGFEEAFRLAKEKVQQYPNCEAMILELAALLNYWRTIQEAGKEEEYDRVIDQWYETALASEDEQIRTMAADALFAFYLGKKQYDKAGEYLTYFSDQNPEKKRKQAVIFTKTGRRDEAYKLYEELLFSTYQMTNILFYSLFGLSVEDENREKARTMAEKQGELARLFEMSEYYGMIGRHECAVWEKDAQTTIETAQKMIESIDGMDHFKQSPLYEHMTFRETSAEFAAELKENLRRAFMDDESYSFLKDDARWQKDIIERFVEESIC